MTMYFLDYKDGKDTNTGLSFDQAFRTEERLYKEIDKNIARMMKEGKNILEYTIKAVDPNRGTTSTMVADDFYAEGSR